MDEKIERGGMYIVFNAETGSDIATAKIADAADPKKTKFVPELKSYEKFLEELKLKEYAKIDKKSKVDATREKNKELFDAIDHKATYNLMLDDYNKKLQMLAVNPPFAFVKVVTMIVNAGDKREIIQWENENNDPIKEAKIIGDTITLLHANNHGGDSFNSHAIVTFNGKRFDIPLMIERGQIRGVTNMPYSWLERLTHRGDREASHDLIEYRSYQNTPVNKLSLSRNLAIRFGADFAKVQIDYANCTMGELKFYSLDQVLKLEYWYRFHHGLEIPSVKDFLASLPKNTNKKTVDIPNTKGIELPDV